MKLNITIVNNRGYKVYPGITLIIMDNNVMRMYNNGEIVASVEITKDDRIFVNHDNLF